MNDRDEDRAESPRDWDDHLVDRALRELHGERPPDLTASIERALLAGPTQSPPRAHRRHDAPLAKGQLAAMALAAAALVVAVSAWSFASRTTPLRTAAERFEMAVAHGELTIAHADAPIAAALHPGSPTVVLLSRGDRLHTGAVDVTDVEIGPFGVVRVEPRTILEVVDMDVRTKNGWVTAGSLALAVIAGGASWHWLGVRTTAAAGEVLHLQTPAESPLATELATARATSDRLQQENAELRERLHALENTRQAVPIEPPPPAAAAALEPAVAAASPAPTFDDERYQEVLGAIDWSMMGKVAAEMGIPLVELMQKLEAGEELPMELAVQISQLNMQLVAQLPKLIKSGLPGTGANGAYTHPLVVANQIAGLLGGQGVPLDASQRDAMAALVRHFTAEVAGIHDTPSELDLDRLVAEVSMKDRMYDELAQQLSPEQRAKLYPEGAGTFDGTSLFRSGLMWQGIAAPVESGTPTAYAESTTAKLTEQLGLTGDAASQVRAILAQAATNAPGEVWATSSPVERSPNARFLRTGRTLRAAQLQQNWMRRVLREVPLSPQQRTQLRAMQRVFVPVPR